MTDRYAKIRKALAMGTTPGPWSVRYDYVVQAKSFDEGRLVPIAQPYGLRVDGSDLFANAAHIAACDPDTIRALLAERDALNAENERLRKDADRYRWLKKSAFCNVWERGDGVALVVPRATMASIDSRIDAALAAYDLLTGDNLRSNE